MASKYPQPTAKDLKRLDDLIFKLSNTDFMELIETLEKKLGDC